MVIVLFSLIPVYYFLKPHLIDHSQFPISPTTIHTFPISPTTVHTKAMKVVSQIPSGSPITHLHLHPGSALCATAGDDLTLRLFDIEASRLVRRFKGHR